jgi:hypothetical protein
MRVNIEGRWRAEDMANSLLAVRDLYNLRLVLQVMREDAKDMEEFWFEMHHFPPFRRWMKHRRFHPMMFQMPFSQFPTIPLDSEQLASLADFTLPKEELVVSRIQYASPGFKDLTGIGDVIGHVKDFVVRVIELWCDREKRRLENEKTKTEIEGMRIENAKQFVSLAKECGHTEAELRRMTRWVDDRQETIIVLVQSGMIQSAHILSGSTTQQEE